MYNGQANTLMMATVLFGRAAAARQHWNRAALWLALAALIKSYLIGLALVLLILYPRKFALRFVAFLTLGLLLPFAAQSPDYVLRQYQGWLHHLSDSTELMRDRLRSFDYLMWRYGLPISATTFNLLGVVTGGAVLGLSLIDARRGIGHRELLTRVFLLFSVWTVLFGPATEACTYIAVGPALAWSVLDAWQRRLPWPARGWLLVSLFFMGPAVTDMVGPGRHLAYAFASQPLGALMYVAYLLCDRPAPGATQRDVAAPPQALPRAA